MLKLIYRNGFIKDVQKAQKRNNDLTKLKIVTDLLLKNSPLPLNYKNHKLKGDYKGFWECHILPDLLLIYEKTETEIVFTRLGSHSDLF